MKTKTLLALIVLIVCLSCKETNGGLKKAENGGDNVYSVESDDKQMNAAIEKAINSYDRFLAIFDKADSNTSDFSVKLMFPYADGNEHMWLNDIFKKRDTLYGVLDSDPMMVTSVRSGDTVAIRKDKISDWMYLHNDTLIGGYTIRVLYDKMSESERKKFRSETSFIME